MNNKYLRADIIVLGAGLAPRHKGVWFSFGHQGLTLGPMCGRMLAEMINGETTYLDVGPFAPSRFA